MTLPSDPAVPPAPAELLVLSHLRWTYVWQRPQHLISRLARERRTWFVEEPMATDVDTPRLAWVQDGEVTRVWLEVPGSDHHVHFTDPRAVDYGTLLHELAGDAAPSVTWIYTPMALDLADEFEGSLLVYDVMDDLASFKDAPPALVLRQRQALRKADLVFTGGRSLHRGVLEHRPAGAHLFASGVEPEHYAPALERQPGSRPVAGYVGVLDERIDFDLLRDLAANLPDWELRLVGPVAKIDAGTLPRASNITYTGPKPYKELPAAMAEFDVALMPFAMNEATRSISPTKTLEYLSAGLPVVSTRVPDVVSDYSELVDLQDDGAGFARACRRVREHCRRERAERARPALEWQHWDSIAERMAALMDTAATSATRKETA
ncbi:MAG: glycosyltransferase [Actinobacteria bacterium]|nr:glycosyltransferase [Actinomycetota bacterium]